VLTSPVGLAVGVVPGSGRYAGVVSTETILSRVTQIRVQHEDAVVVRAPGSRPAGHVVEDGHAAIAGLGAEGGQDVAFEALRPQDDDGDGASAGDRFRAVKADAGAAR